MFEFKKIKNDHNRLRDDTIICETCSPIVVGEPVRLFGEAKDETIRKIGGCRMVSTSPVVSIEYPAPNVTRVLTESGSTYEITELKN